MPFEKVNGRLVYYEVHGEGEGEMIMLLHHGFGCGKIWKGIYPQFIERGFRVAFYDRRGFGRSEAGDGFTEFYESDRYNTESVEELKALKEVLGIGRCHVVGQCEGGVIGAYYAAKYPDEVITLTMGSTQCYSEIPMTELNAQRLVNRFTLLEPALQAKMVDWHGKDAQVRYDQFAFRGGAYGCDFFDLRPVLPLVRCPALVLYPDRSAIFYVEQAVALYRGLPRGELAVFPRCGHNTYDQRPEDYGRTVLDFLMRCAGRDGQKAPPSMTCLA
jgi:pimeloyl-ACP methyl ester carboxylesterase